MKMPKTIPLLCLVLACFMPNSLSSCSCDSIPSFLERIDKGTLILQVQVIGHAALPADAIRLFLAGKYPQEEDPTSSAIPPRPLPPYPYHSYTMLKVTDLIMGAASIGDTIVFFNGAGAMCLGSFENRAPGMKYVLKVQESSEEVFGEDIKDWLRAKGLMDKDWGKRRIFSSGICHEWLLEMEGQMVSGRITRDNRLDYIRDLRENSLSLEQRQGGWGEIQRMGRKTMPYMELAGSIRRIEREIE
jgi:hypothetical protein